MKKLINRPEDVLADALKGIDAAHPELRVDHQHRVIYRGQPKADGKVALISGGGSGHEPLHGGFVGAGMLDAACCGEVFTSPTPDQMQEATTVVDRGAGVLHIVKNYTGDVMNFEMAGELAAADSGVRGRDGRDRRRRRRPGLHVDRRSPRRRRHRAAGEDRRRGGRGGPRPRRRPRAGQAGQRPGPLDGHGADQLHGAAAGKPTFDLPEDQMEMGVGIHGEPGRHRVPLAGAAEIAEMLVEPDPRRPRLHGRPGHRDAQRAWAARRSSSCT